MDGGPRPHTVLLVEDDEHLRGLIAATLPDDWRLVEAVDGLEGLSMAQIHRPDAVILDHGLPLLDGAAVCAALRRAGLQMRIIGLTAYHDSEVRDALIEAGADAVLLKPFSPMRLLDMLERWESSVA